MNLNLLLNEIEVDNENCDFRFIVDYEEGLRSLKRIFGNHEVVMEIEEALDELKENAEDDRAFELIKSETLANTDDEDLAEDIAWELVYS